jgi:hypothetical protein
MPGSIDRFSLRHSMKSIADQLPPEIARQIHPDRRKNEAAVRDQLLDQYRGQWIGFADGTVIASGSSPVTVFHAAEASGLHPFFICVGREDEPCRVIHEQNRTQLSNHDRDILLAALDRTDLRPNRKRRFVTDS